MIFSSGSGHEDSLNSGTAQLTAVENELTRIVNSTSFTEILGSPTLGGGRQIRVGRHCRKVFGDDELVACPKAEFR